MQIISKMDKNRTIKPTTMKKKTRKLSKSNEFDSYLWLIIVIDVLYVCRQLLSEGPGGILGGGGKENEANEARRIYRNYQKSFLISFKSLWNCQSKNSFQIPATKMRRKCPQSLE